MADFAKGVELLGKEGTRRLTWLCGQPALVVDYTNRFKYVHGGDVAYTWLEKAEHMGDVLAGVTETPLIVFGAGVLTDEQAGPLDAYAKSRRVSTPVLLVDEGASAWRTVKVGKFDTAEANPELRSVFVNPRKSSLLVEATLPETDKGQENAREVVRQWLPEGTRSGARAVCEAVGYDMSAAREVAMKARALGTSNERVLAVLARKDARSGYVEALTRCDKVTAAIEAEHVPDSAYGSSIARLDYTLDVMARIHRVLRHGDSTHELASKMGIHRVVVGRFRPYARHYTGRDVARRTAVLVWADEQIRAGRRKGVLEMVAAQW